jgi:NADPH:quinone reductase-like Zn-dependent oxidoreductase
MRAAVVRAYGDPDVVEVEDVEQPLVGPDAVLVEVAAAGVNPVDWKIVSGGLQGAIPTHLPMIPGWDVAGTVTAVGPAITDAAVGDWVAAYARKDSVEHGTFAEQAAVPRRALAIIPSGVELTVAGALPLAGMTAEQLLDAAKVGRGDTVLVHAASGGVGSFAVQLAALRGARVIGTASEANHEYVCSLGAEPVSYGDRLVDNVRAVADAGVDAVIDLVGGDALAATPQLLRAGGRVASVIEADTVKRLGGTYVFVHADSPMLARLLQLVADGALNVEIAQTYPLAQAGAALAAVKGGHTRGKVVITTA